MITIKKTLALSLAGLFILAACSTNDDPDPDDQTKIQIENSIQSSTWRITKFIDSGDDETSDFSGYAFTFSNSGSLTATNGVNTYSGTWSITTSNSNDDSQDDLDFNIFFNLTNSFEELNDDWDILSHSTTRMELVDISGGNGSSDYLTFEKN